MHNQNNDKLQEVLFHVNNLQACLSQNNSSELLFSVRTKFNYNRFSKCYQNKFTKKRLISKITSLCHLILKSNCLIIEIPLNLRKIDTNIFKKLICPHISDKQL